MQNALFAIAASAGFAFLGLHIQRNPSLWIKVFTLGMHDGTATIPVKIIRVIGWFYLIFGSVAGVLFSARLVYDLVVHGTEF
jgi:hypothetical protein